MIGSIFIFRNPLWERPFFKSFTIFACIVKKDSLFKALSFRYSIKREVTIKWINFNYLLQVWICKLTSWFKKLWEVKNKNKNKTLMDFTGYLNNYFTLLNFFFKKSAFHLIFPHVIFGFIFQSIQPTYGNFLVSSNQNI